MKRRRASVVAVLLASACHGREAPATSSISGDGSGAAPEPALSPHKRELLALYDIEEQQRAATDFATTAPSDAALGPDPYRIVRAGKTRFGLLRGDSMVVAIGDDGTELARIAAPKSPSGLAAAPDGSVLVVGEDARELARFSFSGGKLERTQTIAVDALGLRDVAIAADGRTAYVVEERDGRLLSIALSGGRATELGRCHGPVQVAVTPRYIATNCLLDHSIEVRTTIDPRAHPPLRIHHDGPLWSMAIAEHASSLLVAAGGVEDHPLLREDGGFGYIDSFVYLYRADTAEQPGVARLAAINTSELGVVTPKWIALDVAGGTAKVTTAGYATPLLLTLSWQLDHFDAKPEITTAELPPGTAGAELSDDGLIAANSLLDAWVIRRGKDLRIAPVAAKPRDVESRIGELLFFTNLMAPWNGTEGKLSRFTCETCHHEGYGDGRTHFTGRGDIHATTRPLLGLFNNAPYFSRALDQSMTQMVHSEFKVANRHNGRDPWFELTRADLPWLARVPGLPDKLSPELLRRSFMAFLRDFTHRTNPATVGHESFTALERTGAETFRARCASCHVARLIADDDKTAVGFERWEKLVLSASGGIVWNNAAYAKTGVLPYVHDEGTRVPSLRRLYKKWPYFTNGTAKSLGEVLDRYGFTAAQTFHDGAPTGATRLTADENKSLAAFLALL